MEQGATVWNQPASGDGSMRTMSLCGKARNGRAEGQRHARLRRHRRRSRPKNRGMASGRKRQRKGVEVRPLKAVPSFRGRLSCSRSLTHLFLSRLSYHLTFSPPSRSYLSVVVSRVDLRRSRPDSRTHANPHRISTTYSLDSTCLPHQQSHPLDTRW